MTETTHRQLMTLELMTLAVGLPLALAAGAGCGATDSGSSTQPSKAQEIALLGSAVGDPNCPEWGCGGNSASVYAHLGTQLSRVPLEELDMRGELYSRSGLRLVNVKSTTDAGEPVEYTRLEVQDGELVGVPRRGVGGVLTLELCPSPVRTRAGSTWVETCPEKYQPTFKIKIEIAAAVPTPLWGKRGTEERLAYRFRVLEDALYPRPRPTDPCPKAPLASPRRPDWSTDNQDPGDLGDAASRYIPETSQDTSRGCDPTSLCKIAFNWQGRLEDPSASSQASQTPLALLVEGETYEYNTSSVAKRGDEAKRWLNFACAGSALAKVQLLGYGPEQPNTTWEQRQAALKMVTAKYCPSPMRFTQTGTPLHAQDARAGFTPQADMQNTQNQLEGLEAHWDRDGAVCLDTPRLEHHGLDNDQPSPNGQSPITRAQVAQACQAMGRQLPRCRPAPTSPPALNPTPDEGATRSETIQLDSRFEAGYRHLLPKSWNAGPGSTMTLHETDPVWLTLLYGKASP